MLAHPSTMARFNAWAGTRLRTACQSLTTTELALDRGAFFGSILGTLNHILLVDLLYRERIEAVPSRFTGLDEILHEDLASLDAAQIASDRYYIDLLDGMDESELAIPIGFHTLLEDAEYWEVPRRTYFSNLFQHQVHHRGQIHNMLSQAGMDPPAIGYIEYQLEHGSDIVRRKA